MIQITDKDRCCGCKACVQICPKHCIEMYEDEEGFLYPEVDTLKCIKCDLCEKACPMLQQAPIIKPLYTYAAKHANDQIRMESSSGGVFTLLAEQIMASGGVVFGARFDEKWEVVHDYADTMEGVTAFRGSKYLQSRVEDTFRQADIFLKQGRKVLFSGAPCQIAGLKRFLRKEYDHLYTVEFICHGVPSPKIWRKYLSEEQSAQRIKLNLTDKTVLAIENIRFRDKRSGWKNFSVTLSFSWQNEEGIRQSVSRSDTFNKNMFIQGFLQNLYLRPSCYNCPSKCGKSGSDITIGDFWGLRKYYPDFDDDKGASAILVNNEKGRQLFDKISVLNLSVRYEEILESNLCIEKSVAIPEYRDFFWQSIEQKTLFELMKIIKKKNDSCFSDYILKLKYLIKKCL